MPKMRFGIDWNEGLYTQVSLSTILEIILLSIDTTPTLYYNPPHTNQARMGTVHALA